MNIFFRRNSIKILFVISAMIGLSSCATTGSDSGTQTRKSSSAASEVPSLGAISVKNLPNGKCGMLLWTLDGQIPQLIFRHVVDGDAIMVFDGQEKVLKKLNEAGQFRYGFGTNLTLRADFGDYISNIKVETEYGQSFQGGTYLQRGNITITQSDGWQRVTPVAGLGGCRKAS